MPRFARPLLVYQTLAGIAAVAILVAWPPRRGPMLMLPLGARPAETVAAAVIGGAAILGRGPVDGSLVVLGERARVAAAIRGRWIVLLAAPATGCGDIAAREIAA